VLLKKMKLENFRQFVGEQIIEFETNDDKNITVILGENTSGKTTLIKSFKWVLYGKTDFETKSLLNTTVSEKLKPGNKENVAGEIELVHRGTLYVIRREQTYFRNNYGEVKLENARFSVQHKTSEGQLKYLDKSQVINIVNKILPEDLSEYFFFHGEQIKTIGENRRSGKKNIKEAVESLLGLETLDSAITHLSRGDKTSVIGKLNKEIDVTDNEELDKKTRLYEEKSQRLNKIKNDIEENKDIIESFEEQVMDINIKIKDNMETKKLKTEIENNNKIIEEKREIKEKKINEFKKEISVNSPMFFMQPLLDRALKMVDNFEEIDEGIPGMEAKAIENIIEKRGKCICGCEIVEGSEVYNNLKEIKKYLPPESIGTIVRLFKKDISHNKFKGENFYDKTFNLVKEIRTIDNEIKELESQNDNYSDEIKNKPDVGSLEKEVRDLNKKIQHRRKKLNQLLNEEGSLEKSVNDLDKEIQKLAAENEKNEFILKCLDYAKYINDKFESHYKSLEKEIKNKLEERTNSIFNKIYHGNRDLILKNNYEYDLTTTDIEEDKSLDLSEGLKTVASFSFIAGIVSLAKEKVHDTNNEEISQVDTEPYPLVMDAPFSDTDERHVQNISKVIPNVAEQTIMIIMEKDWKYAKNVLEDELSKIYIMDKKKETITHIKEVN